MILILYRGEIKRYYFGLLDDIQKCFRIPVIRVSTIAEFSYIRYNTKLAKT